MEGKYADMHGRYMLTFFLLKMFIRHNCQKQSDKTDQDKKYAHM